MGLGTALNKRIDTWRHCDRRTAARVLDVSIRAIRLFEEDGTLTGHRDAYGRVYFDRHEIDAIRQERLANKTNHIVLDFDEEQGAYVPLPPGMDPRLENENTRHLREVQMREQEYEQRERLIATQQKFYNLAERYLPKFLQALEKQGTTEVVKTVITAIPEQERSLILGAIVDVFKEAGGNELLQVTANKEKI
jgi:DNA-binding transcriptional MerR regulator